MQTHSLLEINGFLRRVLALNLPEPLWVGAEIAEVSLARGHVFIELVEKAEEMDELAAQATAVIWERTYRQLRRARGKALEDVLRPGLAVRLRVRPDFHERYGLKFVVQDVDPAYTLGVLATKRQQTIDRLKAEGLWELNRQQPLPIVIQRVAVISSLTAAGYQDFRDQLLRNTPGYVFDLQFFPAAMQGPETVGEISRQLRTIARRRDQLDAVVIIRGGGSRPELAVFDEAALAEAVARAPLAVLTGIGHETDESILDWVAHTALKTPTAVADFLIDRAMAFEQQLDEAALQIFRLGTALLQRQSNQLHYLGRALQQFPTTRLQGEQQRLTDLQRLLPLLATRQLSTAERELQHLQQLHELLSMEATLARGFALVYQQDRLIRDGKELRPGDPISLRFRDGEIGGEISSE